MMELDKDKIKELLAGEAVLSVGVNDHNTCYKDLICSELSLSLETRVHDEMYAYLLDGVWGWNSPKEYSKLEKEFQFKIYSMQDLIKKPVSEDTTETLDIASMRISNESVCMDQVPLNMGDESLYDKPKAKKDPTINDCTTCNGVGYFVINDKCSRQVCEECSGWGAIPEKEPVPQDTIFTIDKDGNMDPSPESVGLKPITIKPGIYGVPPDPEAPASKYALTETFSTPPESWLKRLVNYISDMVTDTEAEANHKKWMSNLINGHLQPSPMAYTTKKEPVPTPKEQFIPKVGKRCRFWDDDPKKYVDLLYALTFPNGKLGAVPPPWEIEFDMGSSFEVEPYDNMSPIPKDVDYKELLVKYIEHVSEEDGSTYLQLVNNGHGKNSIVFTKEEVEALRESWGDLQ